MPFLRYTQECLDAAQGKWPASGAWSAEPAEKRRERPKTIRVFENDFLEKVFARSHPILPIVWFGPVILYGIGEALWRAGLLRTVGWFALGWLAWTFLEYLLHRFLFHMPAHTPEQKFRSFMVHGYHHEFPNDKLRLVAPPLMSWPLALVVGTLYHYLVGPNMWIMFAGTATGYVAYDWIHYYTHHARPSWPLGKFLRRYHMKHHFKDGNAWYGVSSPLWDYVFGTHKSKLESGATEAEAH
jgi:sterol desaturase/sphingolipid hydroxylase (fatty acid hydroxylase superfamily)